MLARPRSLHRTRRGVSVPARHGGIAPCIQYAQTADGVSIAFWALGEGAPIIQMPWIPWSHIQLSWQLRRSRHWYQRLAKKRKVVAYDGRGTGLSQRDVTDFSLDAHVLDLQAIADCLGLESFALFGFGESGPAAIAYAARYPERVSHLILWCAWACASDVMLGPRQQAISALRASGDWELYIETLVSAALGRLPQDQTRRAIAFMRQCASPDSVRAAFRAIDEFNVTSLLSQVRSPTLVLHPKAASCLEGDIPMSLASRIPHARLAVIEGVSPRPYFGRTETVLQTVEEFLDEGEEDVGGHGLLASDALRTILFTDLEAWTALAQRLGDAGAQEILRRHERIVRGALEAHRGLGVKGLGDGFMASFSSATRALECAIAIQRAFAEHNETAAEPIRVRIGLNAGEPIAEEKDLFGTAVNLAARITATAGGGEILVSDVVRQLVAGKSFVFNDRGEVALRGFENPVRLFEVRWRASGPPARDENHHAGGRGGSPMPPAAGPAQRCVDQDSRGQSEDLAETSV